MVGSIRASGSGTAWSSPTATNGWTLEASRGNGYYQIGKVVFAMVSANRSSADKVSTGLVATGFPVPSSGQTPYFSCYGYDAGVASPGTGAVAVGLNIDGSGQLNLESAEYPVYWVQGSFVYEGTAPATTTFP